MIDPNELMCETCHRPVDTITNEAGEIIEFWHASHLSVGPAHDPVPVPRVETQATLCCDFCGAPDPAWRYPATTFDQPDLTRPTPGSKHPFDMLTPRSCGDWCACPPCHIDIQAGRWDDIANRLLRGEPRDVRREAKPHIRRLHRQFLNNRTGPPTPIRRPQWT
jgi:hypothetical protein